MILNADKERTLGIYKAMGLDERLDLRPKTSTDEYNHLIWIRPENARFIDSLLEKGWLEIFRHPLCPPIAISPEFAKQYSITIDSTDEDVTLAFEKHFASIDKSITATI